MANRVRPHNNKWVILDDDGEIAGIFGSKAMADKVCKGLNKPKPKTKPKTKPKKVKKENKKNDKREDGSMDD
tara:strand:+ start:109 stop:324 length:216 start_codon:yes stop_codon:yes gene_type:complete